MVDNASHLERSMIVRTVCIAATMYTYCTLYSVGREPVASRKPDRYRQYYYVQYDA